MQETKLTLPDGRVIAYQRQEGRGPVVVFLGGFRSDMTGTKAQHLADWCAAGGRAFLRFDYTGHGASSGDFLDGAIGDWARDAFDAVERLTEGPLVLVGSSMGGWISLLLAKRIPDRIAAFIGIAPAPDFTEDSMWAGFSAEQRATLETAGRVEVPTDYADEPYVITRRLIEDGRENLVLRAPLDLPFPVRILHGTADTDVDRSVASRLLDHATCADMTLTLVKGSDHRFSAPDDLALISRTLADLLAAAESPKA
jgi:pimeloyl-ACP methyl ester carboxylesterase